jgi:hypothetical protein
MLLITTYTNNMSAHNVSASPLSFDVVQVLGLPAETRITQVVYDQSTHSLSIRLQ